LARPFSTSISPGTYLLSGTSYNLTANGSDVGLATETLNVLSGSDSQFTTTSNTATLAVLGSNGSGNYTQTDQIMRLWTWQQQGNTLTGDYTGTGAAAGAT
jgi:hypothetical protein